MDDQTAQTQQQGNQDQQQGNQDQQQGNSYVDDYVPPYLDDNQPSDSGDMNDDQTDQTNQNTISSDGPDNSDEDIESQNIFFMLGVDEGDEDLKEKFLDQLQEAIWDDFLANDVELLLTQDEMTEFTKLEAKADDAEGEDQEKNKDELVEYLEGLIPDLEDIMLEKALDLKSDLFVERINGMKEYFAENNDKLGKVNEAEQLMFEDKWKSAAKILNEISE